MTPAIVIRPRAVLDIEEQSLYLAASSTRVALRCQKSVQQSMQRLAERPDLGALYESETPQLEGIRFWAVRGFPNHLICYRQVSEGVDVLRVLHGARDLPTAFDG